METVYRSSGKPIEKAGLAHIKYEENQHWATREGDLITLPTKHMAMYQLTPSFDQFLLLSTFVCSDGEKDSSAYFGGTDELPFLVQLEEYDWLEAWQKDNFYEEIKPDRIKELEAKFGNQTIRQGDMFCYPLPMEPIFPLRSTIPNNGGRDNLFGTRHEMKDGVFIETNDRAVVIAKGTLRAPDHKDVALKEFHIITQTKRLYSPQIAD